MKPLFKIIYRFYRLLSWLRYTASRRYTPAGLLVLVALLATAMIGTDVESTVAYQAFAVLLFIGLISLVFSLSFRANFSASRRLPRFGTAGQPFPYHVVIKNLARRRQTDLTLLENLADPRPAFDEWLAVQQATEQSSRSFRVAQRRRKNPFKQAAVNQAAVPPMGANEEVEVRLEMTPLRRGVIRFNGVTLARPDPFGLVRAFAKKPLPQSVLVLPRRYPLPPIALPGVMKYQQGGVALASNIGQSDEFVALRDYRHGDPLRHIHWRSWAKTGQPIVREFEDEFFARHALVLDTFVADPRSEAFEEAVSVAASFACALETQESLLDLLFIGTEAYCFTAGRGLAHADQLLEILASVRACPDRKFSTLEHLVLDHAAVVSGCICVLLAWDEERRSLVKKLQSLGVPVLVLVVAEAGAKEQIERAAAERPEQFFVLETGKIAAGLAALEL